MASLFYSETAQNIIGILCQEPNQSYHINELIRKTGKYPYSVQTALKKLTNFKLVTNKYFSNRKLYKINVRNPLFPEIQSIFSKLGYLIDTHLAPLDQGVIWIKKLNRRSSLPITFLLTESFNQRLKALVGINFNYFWFNGVTNGIYYSLQEYNKAQKNLLKAQKNKNFKEQLIKEFEERVNNLYKTVQNISVENLNHLSDQKIIFFLKQIKKAYFRLFPFYLIPPLLEEYLQKKIIKQLKKYLGLNLTTEQLNRHFQALTSLTKIHEEQASLLKIARIVKNRGWNNTTKKLLSYHLSKFSHLSVYTLLDQPQTQKQITTNVKLILKKYPSPQLQLKKLEEQNKKNRDFEKRFFLKIKNDKQLSANLVFYKNLLNLRTKRSENSCFINLRLKQILQSLAVKRGLVHNSLFYLTFNEILNFINTNKINIQEVQKRKGGWALLLFNGRIRIISGLPKVMETIERLRIVSYDVDKHSFQIKKLTGLTGSGPKTIKGTPVYNGKIKGVTKIVLGRDDFSKISKGDVLIIDHATPAYLSSFYKASGVVVNENAPTGHAAFYAKTLKIPSIMGTNNATSILEDNQNVILDANKGIIKIIDT